MNLGELKEILEKHPKKGLRFILPNGKPIPSHFHVTEVGHVQKNFIDCGGTSRTTSSCVLQAWVAANDEDHSLEAGKLAKILDLAQTKSILPTSELAVEVEFEAPYISQFPIASTESQDEAIVFYLAAKHTDCLAKEQCGLEGESCCSTES